MIAKKIDPKSKADPNAASKNELKSVPMPELEKKLDQRLTGSLKPRRKSASPKMAQ